MSHFPILSFLKLIRIGNVLIAVGTQWLFYYLLYYRPWSDSEFPFIQSNGINYLLSATAFIASSGYLVNNIFDRDADQITKTKEVIIGQKISLISAWILYFILLSIGLGLGIVLAIKLHHPWLAILFAFLTAGLFLYSFSWKKIPMLGNLFIAFSSAAVIFILPIAAWLQTFQPGDHQIFSWTLELTFVFSLFAFISTLIREWIKDLEDLTGDQQSGFKTLAVMYPALTQKLSFFLTIFMGLGLLFWSLFHFEKLELTGKWFLLFQLILISFIAFRIHKAENKTSYSFLSLWLKVTMILGLLYLLFWHV